MYETIKLEVKEHVAILTLNRPDKLNAFTPAMNKEITKVLGQVDRDDTIRVLIVTGEGRAFCSGEDLSSVHEGNIDHGEVLRTRYNPMISKLHHVSKPVIAAVNGVAAGAGCSLALACDFRIASNKAVFVEAFVHIGLVPDSGSCYFLPRIVGWAKALELAILGEQILADKAHAIGLVTQVCEHEQLMEEALIFANRLATMPIKAIGLIKRTMAKAMDSTLEEALALEAYAQDMAGQTKDHQEAVAAFLEKRKPRFEGK